MNIKITDTIQYVHVHLHNSNYKEHNNFCLKNSVKTQFRFIQL